jgi:hypothetical protein
VVQYLSGALAMPTRIIKREELVQVLNDWQSGRLSSAEVLSWADALYLSGDVDYEDWEEDNSVTKEILAGLDMLDMNLALPKDAPIYLEFLSTPAGQFESGHTRFQRRLDEIDCENRRAHVPAETPVWRSVRYSIIAIIILASFPLAFFIWMGVDRHFSGRDRIVAPLVILFALSGAIASFFALALAAKRRPVSVGFSVYAMLHGAGCLYFAWKWGYSPSVFDVLAGVSICVGLRAHLMRKKHDHAA